MKKSLALMLALIMVLCMIPTTAFATLNTGHKIDVRFTVLYVGDEFNIGYNYGASEKTQFVCQYLTNHSDTAYNNHTIAISDIKAAADSATVNSGYQIVGWSKESSANPTVWPLNKSGTTACNKGTTIYLVAKNPNPQPTKPTANDIPGIVGNNAVKVHCTTNTSHADNTYGLINGSFTIGDVTKDTTSGNYTCTITVQSEKYVNDYNASINVNHKLDGSSTGTITLKWDGSKWKVDSGVPVVFNVKCDNTQPSTDKPEKPEPENTSKPVVGLTSKDAVEVECITKNSGHAKQAYQLIEDSYTVGEVSGDKEKGYTCEITVKPEKYVDQYNLDIEGGHKLDPESQIGKIKLKWNENKWEVVNGVPVVFDVKCEKTQPPLDPITIEVSKVWNDDSGTAKKPEKITVLLLANGQEVKNATIKPNNEDEDTWFYRFDNMPANDINDKPINYTVKEEDVSGWTPYYWTAGPWNNLLAFQIHNVPTVNTREIKVTKKVSGDGADKAKYFDFKVTLLEYSNGDMETPVGWYQLGGINTFGGVIFTKGVATFKLKDGESFEIKGIPSNLQYKVEEVAPSGYTVKVNGSAGSSINGAFTDAKTVNIAFENVKESGTNPTPTPTPTSTPGGGNGGGGHWHPTTTPVPVIVIPPKTGDMTIWQSILHFLGII